MRNALFVISFWLALVRGEEKLRSVKTLSSTWGVGTIVADFARQIFATNFSGATPMRNSPSVLFSGM